jgi:hypothetical protein
VPVVAILLSVGLVLFVLGLFFVPAVDRRLRRDADSSVGDAKGRRQRGRILFVLLVIVVGGGRASQAIAPIAADREAARRRPSWSNG